MKANDVPGLGLDEIFTRLEGNTARHFLPDALGSTLALTDANGAVQTSYTYAPFGATTSTGQTNTNPFKFTGREDDGTGLYHYRARYYHPGLSRFIARIRSGSRAAMRTCTATFETILSATLIPWDWSTWTATCPSETLSGEHAGSWSMTSVASIPM